VPPFFGLPDIASGRCRTSGSGISANQYTNSSEIVANVQKGLPVISLSAVNRTGGSSVPSKFESARPVGLTDEDYEEIVEAVMETSRGRWFLGEFSQRNRTADTAELLAAISRLKNAIPSEIHTPPQDAVPNANAIRGAIGEMAEEINATKREIASIGQDSAGSGNIAGATAELDAVMNATENATSDILEAAEAVQEIAWTLREESVADEYCDALDMRATEIYTACSFQDITGQRTQKVVRLLKNLDQRITILAKLWADTDETAAPAEPSPATKPDEHLLNGPALGDQGVSQTDIDEMMDSAAWVQDDKAEASAEMAQAPAPASNDETPGSADGTTESSIEDLSQKDMDALFA